MTAPGNSVVLILLLAAFLACTGYAGGRLHQWYRMGQDRDEAYRDGYDTATRSVFSMAARIISPRRTDRSAIRASAAVVIPASAVVETATSPLPPMPPGASGSPHWTETAMAASASHVPAPRPARDGSGPRPADVPLAEVPPASVSRAEVPPAVLSRAEVQRADVPRAVSRADVPPADSSTPWEILSDDPARPLTFPSLPCPRPTRSRQDAFAEPGVVKPDVAGEAGPGVAGHGVTGSGVAGPALSWPALSWPDVGGVAGPGVAGPGVAGPGVAGPALTGPGFAGPALDGRVLPRSAGDVGGLGDALADPAAVGKPDTEPMALEGRPEMSADGRRQAPEAETRGGRHMVPDELVQAATYRLPPDRVARAKVRDASTPSELSADPTWWRPPVPKPRSNQSP